MDDLQVRYRRAVGARILAVANDLKRTSDSLATELGFDPGIVRSVIDGDCDENTALAVVYAMAATYPIPLSEIWMEKDDTVAGVRIMTQAQSSASSRVFERSTANGELAPYYEYRDTAMSSGAQFKPEWIRELRVPRSMDPSDPDVVYNNGHALHQTTFFVGEVNFYWQLGDIRHCAQLNTGDSNYITPYVPHSFASRNANNLGLIIAVTFGAEVQRSLAEMSRLDHQAATDLVADPRNPNQAFVDRIKRWAQAESLSRAQLTERLVSNGMARNRAKSLLERGMSTAEERDAIAQALRIRSSDLDVTPLLEAEEVVLHRRMDGESRFYPDVNDPACELRELARTRHQPLLKGFDVAVSPKATADFTHSLHEYIYNYGDVPVDLRWSTKHMASLMPGDSAYVRPFVRHTFRATDGIGHLVVVRTPGGLTETVANEFSTFREPGRARTIEETSRWF